METIRFIGHIQSPLKEIKDCPLQEDEGAPQVTIYIEKEFLPAISELAVGIKIVLLTWLHKADRTTMTTHPRNNPAAYLPPAHPIGQTL